MKLKNLSELRRQEPREIVLAPLPREIPMSSFASAKAFTINRLVRELHKSSYEWYGFTLAKRDEPERITDIGLPENDRNTSHYTAIGSEHIMEYLESIPEDLVINGWIHSHGNLLCRQFSETDENNHLTVLDYVTTVLRKPVAKREVLVGDLELLVKGEYATRQLERGSVTLITDVPVSEATLMETVYGGFCYAIVVGDSGWHRQEIHYKRRGILTGLTSVSRLESSIVLLEGGRSFEETDRELLRNEVREKIKPHQPSVVVSLERH